VTVTLSVEAGLRVIRPDPRSTPPASGRRRRPPPGHLDDVFLTLTEPGSGGADPAHRDRSDPDHADRDEVSA
jgi:hypothetical protein